MNIPISIILPIFTFFNALITNIIVKPSILCNLFSYLMCLPKCELPKLIIQHSIGPISAANSRLLLLGHYRPYTKPIVTFTMASSSESRRAKGRPMDGSLLGHVLLLPRQTILEMRKPNFGTKTSVGGQSLGQNWSLSAYRSYHSSKNTILETDLRQHFCRCWASVEPYFTLQLNCYSLTLFFLPATLHFMDFQPFIFNSSSWLIYQAQISHHVGPKISTLWP